MAGIAGLRLVAVAANAAVLFVHVAPLVFSVVAIYAREEAVGRGVYMACLAIVAVNPVLAAAQGEVAFVVEGGWGPGLFGVARGAVRAKVIAWFVVGVAANAVGGCAVVDAVDMAA